MYGLHDSLVQAVQVRSGLDGFMIKMRDGRYLRCVHNNPQGGHLPDYAPHPAIVLKMEDGSDLLLPIIVCMFYFLCIFMSSLQRSDLKASLFVSGDAKCVADGCNSQCSNCKDAFFMDY